MRHSSDKTPVDVVVVAQTPPPHHGQSIMYQYLLEGHYTRVRLHHVRMAFSETLSDVGRLRAGKVLHLVQVVAGVVRQRLRGARHVLYYPPAGPALAPVLRDIILLLLTRWMFRNTVFHFHAAGLADYVAGLPPPLRILARAAYRDAALSIRVSASGPDDGRRLGARRDVVIPNGVADCHASFPRNAPAGPPRILFAGAIRPSKGVDILLEAGQLLVERGVDFQLELMGRAPEPDYATALRERLAKPPWNSRATWAGELHEAEKWRAYSRAALFCFPTYYDAEGLSLVVLEAMMFGLPVVATRWRGLPDAITDGETGYLVPPRDARAVADALERLIRDAALRDALGRNGRAKYERNFALSRWRERMEDALVSVP